MIILIPIETTRRELLYKTYLCHMLALEGFTCYLGNKSRINFLLKKFTNYIYLDKGYHEGKSDAMYSLIRSQNGLIASLDEEGAVDFSDNRTLLKRYSKELFKLVDLVFLWGQKQKEIINPDELSKSKIIVSGHPRFQLLKTDYQIFYNKEAESLKKKYGKFILFSTNMGFGNNIKGDEFVRDGYGKWYKQIDEIIDYDKTKLDIYIKFVKKFSKDYDGNIIIRPHPEENIFEYEKHFKDINNVIVSNKGSVVPWIIASQVMVHPDCTTSIESFFLGKKPISLLPKTENVSHITKLPLMISTCINEYEEFNQAIKNNVIDKGNLDVLNDYFSFDKSSSIIIVNEICKLAKRIKTKNKQKISSKDYLYLNFKGYKSKLSTKKSKKLQRTKLDGLDLSEITMIHNQISLLDSSYKDLEIKKIADKLFYFKVK